MSPIVLSLSQLELPVRVSLGNVIWSGVLHLNAKMGQAFGGTHLDSVHVLFCSGRHRIGTEAR